MEVRNWLQPELNGKSNCETMSIPQTNTQPAFDPVSHILRRDTALSFAVNAHLASSCIDLSQRLLEALKPFLLSSIAYVRLGLPGEVVRLERLFGGGDASSDFIIDWLGDAIPHIFANDGPFLWPCEPSRDAPDISNGKTEGVCVPVLGHHGEIGAVALVGDRPVSLADCELASIGAIANIYARAGLRLNCEAAPEHYALTRRERECLGWAAQGKSDWAISQILGLATRTVHMHIENAKKKLGVNSRAKAVVEAWRRGLLTI